MAPMKWLHQLAQDTRFALRMLRRAPGFTTTVILTLALGIGMTSAVFSVFNAVLLRPLSYPNPERLMWISTRDPNAPFPMETVLAPDFLTWKTQAASFEHIVAYDLSDEPLVIDGNATRERVAMVSEGFWELSGARLAHGRFPAASDQGALLVSYDFFEARLGGDMRSIGKAAIIDGRPATIVGVLPRNFTLHLPWPRWPGFEPQSVAAYRTRRIDPPKGNQIQLLNVVGKLKPGVTIEQARAELETIRARTAQDHPAFRGNRFTLRLVPLSEELTGNARLALTVLLSAVVFVLLIACANVASLLFGRGSARQKEMAIRAAVGAGRARLFGQVLDGEPDTRNGRRRCGSAPGALVSFSDSRSSSRGHSTIDGVQHRWLGPRLYGRSVAHHRACLWSRSCARPRQGESAACAEPWREVLFECFLDSTRRKVAGGRGDGVGGRPADGRWSHDQELLAAQRAPGRLRAGTRL